MRITNNTDDTEELESSTSQNDQDAAADSANNDADAGAGDDASGSSTGADDNDAGLLDVVRDVVSERPAEAASSADGADAGSDPGGASSDGQDDENYSDVPFHKHPRFQNLIRERNSLRDDAGRYQNVQRFIDENGLTSEEAANALTTFARAKVDPAGAFAELKPWLQQLLIDAGEVLPADLKERLDKGELTHDAALELSRSRAATKSHETRRSFDEQRQQRESQRSQGLELVNTAAAWEDDRKKKDPNFAAKYPALQREVAFLQSTEGKPTDKEGVLAQLKKAYEAVNKTFKAPAAPPQGGAPRPQQKPAIKPVTGGTVTGTVRQPPKNTLDIVRANRRKAS